mgnify:CR=1 FL=1
MLDDYAISKNIKTLWLIVGSDNVAAIKLYVKHGFVAEENDPKYDDGTITMYKDLKKKFIIKLN